MSSESFVAFARDALVAMEDRGEAHLFEWMAELERLVVAKRSESAEVPVSDDR